MGFALYSLVQAIVLCLNAVCVLNEQRFLSKLSSSSSSRHRGFGEENWNSPAASSQALHLIRAVQTVVKIPLIALNVMVMTVEVLFG